MDGRVSRRNIPSSIFCSGKCGFSKRIIFSFIKAQNANLGNYSLEITPVLILFVYDGDFNGKLMELGTKGMFRAFD